MPKWLFSLVQRSLPNPMAAVSTPIDVERNLSTTWEPALSVLTTRRSNLRYARRKCR